jgi:hypothetical protein
MTRALAVIEGAAGGAVATVAMSALMLVGDRIGLMSDQPPTAVTRRALQEAGVDRPAEAASAVAPVAHLAFGILGGVVYAIGRRLLPGVPAWVSGIAFGLGVWAVSYKGWIPALGILPPPERDEPGRPPVMIAAHVVYGLVLSAFARPTSRS